MESAPARAQSRIPPFRLSKTVQPAPHKGCGTQRLDTHNAACGIETPSEIQRTDRGGRVSTHTMLRAALKLLPDGREGLLYLVSTHTMLRAALKLDRRRQDKAKSVVSTHTMLRAALKLPSRAVSATHGSPDTHNAACGIDSKTALRVLSVTQSRFVCKNRTAILTMRRTDVSIEIQKGTA